MLEIYSARAYLVKKKELAMSKEELSPYSYVFRPIGPTGAFLKVGDTFLEFWIFASRPPQLKRQSAVPDGLKCRAS